MKPKTAAKPRSVRIAAAATNSRPGQDKKDLAKLLFTRNDFTQKEIAKRVGITEKTIGKWAKDGCWEDQRKSLLVSRETELRNMIDQLSELNTFIKSKPEGQRFANSKEADTQKKLTASIRELTVNAGLTEALEISSQIIGFGQKNFPEDMNTIIKVLDAYVQQFLR